MHMLEGVAERDEQTSHVKLIDWLLRIIQTRALYVRVRVWTFVFHPPIRPTLKGIKRRIKMTLYKYRRFNTQIVYFFL